jgi:hypothetical protein
VASDRPAEVTETLATPDSLQAGTDAQIKELADELRVARAAKTEALAVYDKLRAELWAMVGCQAGKNEIGGFRFTEPKSTRRTDLDLLERRWPEVYAEVVSEVPPNPDAAGRLYL